MRRGLSGRLMAAAALLAVMMGSVFAVMAVAIGAQQDTARRASQDAQRSQTALHVEKLVLDAETGVRGYLVTGDSAFLAPWRHAREAVSPQARVLVSEGGSLGTVTAARQLGVAALGYLVGYTEPVIALAGRDLAQARRVSVTAEGKRRVDALRVMFDAFTSAQDAAAARDRDRAQRMADRAITLAIAGVLTSLVLIGLFIAYAMRTVFAPLRRLAQASDRLAQGDLGVRVRGESAGEVLSLESAFNAMAGALQANRDELESQNTELETQQAEVVAALEALDREKTRLQTLHTFGERLALETELEQLSSVLLEQLADAVGAEVGTLYAAEGERSTDNGPWLTRLQTRGLAEEGLPPRLGPPHGVAGRALSQRRILRTSYGDTGLRVQGPLGEARVQHELHLPLTYGGRVLGLATLGRLGDRPIDAADEEVLTRLAEPSAVALSSALALRAARRAAELNRAVLRSAHDAFIAVDRDGVIVAWNPQAEATFGWSADEALGRRAADLLVPERLRGEYDAGLARLVSENGGAAIDGRIEVGALRQDGSELPVELTITSVEVAGQMRFNAFARDISERQAAERALRESEQRYRSLARNLPGSSVLLFDSELRIVMAEGPLLPAQGYSKARLEGELLGAVLPLDTAQALELHCRAALEGTTSELERESDSQTFSVQAVPVTDGEGEVVAGMLLFQDITARKRASRYASVRQEVSVGVAESSTVAELVAAALEAVGRTMGWRLGVYWEAGPEELSGRGHWAADFIAVDALRAYMQHDNLRRGEGLPGSVWAACAPDWVADVGADERISGRQALTAAGLRGVISLPVSSGDNVLGVMQFFGSDMPEPDEELMQTLVALASQVGQFIERRRAEREAERLKDEFFILVSHELRTPLTSINGYLELLSDREAGELSVEQARFLAVIQRNAQRLLRLVGDLLFVAQVEAGKLSLEAGIVDLAKLVADAVEAARPRAEEHGILLTAHADQVPPCAGDADRIGQLLDNLIVNAIKFTPTDGRVEVLLSSEGQEATIEVADTGCGIPEEEQAHLFDRFYRSRSAVAQSVQGLGLGLTISKAIAEGHGGRIELHSKDGVGTTFRVALPLPGARPADVVPTVDIQESYR